MGEDHPIPGLTSEWADDNPYFLLLGSDDDTVVIDLGENSWSRTFADWMRRPGKWFLCRKSDRGVALALVVHEGEQPYYVQRHIGQVSGPMAREVSCYGIGKKRLDGHVDRLWILPDGRTVCGGDDVELLAIEIVRLLDWTEHAG